MDGHIPGKKTKYDAAFVFIREDNFNPIPHGRSNLAIKKKYKAIEY